MLERVKTYFADASAWVDGNPKKAALAAFVAGVVVGLVL